MHKLFALSFRRIAAHLGQQELTALNVATALQSSKIPPSGEGFLYRLPRDELKHILNIPCPINSVEDSSSQIIIQSSKRLRHHGKINEQKTCAKCPFKASCPCAKQAFTGQLDNTPQDLLIFWSGLSAMVKTQEIYFRQWTSAYKLGDSIIASLNDLAQGGKEIEEYDRIRVEAAKSHQQKTVKQASERPQKATQQKKRNDLNEKYKVIEKLTATETVRKQPQQQQVEPESGFGRDFSFDEGEQFQPEVGFTKDNFKQAEPKKQNKSLKNQKGYQTIEKNQDTRDTKDTRDTRDYRDNRDNRDNRDTRYNKDNRDNRDTRYNKDTRDTRYNKDTRDYRDNKPSYKQNYPPKAYESKYPAGETKAETNYIQKFAKPSFDKLYDKKAYATPKREQDDDFVRQARFDDKRTKSRDDKRYVHRGPPGDKPERYQNQSGSKFNNRDADKQAYAKKNFSNNYERNADKYERKNKYDNPKRNTKNSEYSQQRQLGERKNYRQDHNFHYEQKPKAKPFVEKWNPPENPVQGKDYFAKKNATKNAEFDQYADFKTRPVKKTPAPKIIQVQQADQQSGNRRVGRTVRRRGQSSSTHPDSTQK